MKIYTRTGDDGTTSLYGGMRVPKHHLRIETYGTLDELNSYLGLLRDQKIDTHSSEVLLNIQELLFTIGAVFATPPEKEFLKNGKERLAIERVSKKDIQFLEHEIDALDLELEPMTHFILPGGHTAVSFCHITRCICRRAERLATELHESEPFESNILQYINRLSDYLFVLARMLSKHFGVDEIKWIPKKVK